MKGQLRIEKLFAFIVVDTDGTEGVPAFLGPNQILMPMMGADPARVADLKPIAQAQANQSGRPVSICVFEKRTEVEVIFPKAKETS